jgi:hypothetical protein
MDFHRIFVLLNNEPIGTTCVLLLVAVAVVAACVAAYVGARTAYEMLQQKRQERLRDAAFFEQARRT